jgi:hypothetical protein
MPFRSIALISLALLIGCAERADRNCPTGLDVNTARMDHDIRASYSAQHVRNRVMIRATGELPAGYEAVFVRSLMEVYPPTFTVMRRRLNGQWPAEQQRFDACVQFKETDPVTRVTVNDADGPHEVEVAP